MNKKEEILAKSRNENKNMDLYEKEIQTKAGNIAACVAAVLATIFFVVQILMGEGQNYGFYAVVFSVPATGYIVKSVQMRRKNDITFAVIYIILTLTFSFAHISNLITSSTIL